MSTRQSNRQSSFKMMLGSIFFLAASPTWAASVNLAWDADSDPLVAGYNVHYGTTSGSYTSVASLGASTSTTLNNLLGGATYFFVVAACDATGQEGLPSEEISTVTANTDLAGISLNSGALAPGFVPNVYNYSVTVPNDVSSLSLTPVAATLGQSVAIGGAGIPGVPNGNSISLSTGNNQFTIVVTAPDGSATNTYSVEVTRLNLLQSWRMQNFGTSSSVGAAADLATPLNDGVPNLLKFATGMNPSVPGVMPGTVATTSNGLAFTYVRLKAAMSDGTTCSVVWSDDLTSANWSSDGVIESSIDQGTTELMTELVPMGTSGHRFVRLLVSHP